MEIIYYHEPFSKNYDKSVDHSYSFWRSYRTGRVWSPFPYCDREFGMKTDVFT